MFSFKLFLEQSSNQLLGQVQKYAKKAGFECRDLGGHILLIKNKIKGPHVLVSGTFHGDEPSGSMAIVEVLKTNPDWLNKINVSFLPIVNPTGFSANTRNDKWGGNPNRGFIHDKNKLSKEGKVLKDNVSKMMPLDEFLTLHEDDRYDGFYFYTYKDTPLVKAMIKTGKKFFKEHNKGVTHAQGHDGSFEDYLHHQGVETICVEVPGKADLKEKVKCQVGLIECFVSQYV